MAKKHRAHDEEAWNNAKTICRLDARQVEMARTLGMNPRKLPGLRPSPQERWKLPVGAFIEQCYRKRFGHPPDPEPAEPVPRSRESRRPAGYAPEPAKDPMSQAGELVCYLINLADDLQKWLMHGKLPPEVLQQVSEELRDAAKALEKGALISPMPEIPLPPRGTRTASSRRRRPERTFDDGDDIPF